jgi:hypothetical protein
MNAASNQENNMTFDNALQNFLDKAQAMVDADYARQGFDTQGKALAILPGGRKFLRVVAFRTDGRGNVITWTDDKGKVHRDRHVFCFVDAATGDVLKADGWKRPAKGARGNIFAANPIAGVTSTGAKYL